VSSSQLTEARDRVRSFGGYNILATGTAHTTEDFCAVVLKNRDGWLALRKGPGTRFKIITKLLEGDYLLADTGEVTIKNGHILSACLAWMALLLLKKLMRIIPADGFIENISKSSYVRKIRNRKAILEKDKSYH
jgi:hypothetical protein